MAGQSDGPPQAGQNPTSAWIEGEEIVEEISLAVSPAARPGRYTLSMGFYDAGRGGERLPATGSRGEPLPAARAPLAQIDVAD
jgi:hypothetical protein